jgi:hypothetical protein
MHGMTLLFLAYTQRRMLLTVVVVKVTAMVKKEKENLGAKLLS